MALVFFFFLIYFHYASSYVYPPGLERAQKGYNYMQGNLLQEYEDPGWKNDLFKFEGEGGSGAFDGIIIHINTYSDAHFWYSDYKFPDNIGGKKAVSKGCTEEQPRYANIRGPQHYAEQLSPLGKFETDKNEHDKDIHGTSEASDWYQMIIKDTAKDKDYVFIQNYFSCTYYQIETGENPTVNDDFYNEVKDHMPTKFEDDSWDYWDEFFDKYGTHFVYEAAFGCVKGQLSKMSAHNYSRFTSSNLDIEYASTFSIWSKDKSEKEQGDAFRDAVDEQWLIKRGNGIPSGDDFGKWEDECKKNSYAIELSLKRISYGLEARPFMNIHDISEKRDALSDATSAYCKHYYDKHDQKGYDCSESGWPDDPYMPEHSIIRGFYTDKAEGWNEPKNVYTGDRKCRSDDDAHVAFYVSNPSEPSQNVSVNQCLHTDYGHKDPFNYFGGMYSKRRKNYFTGNKSCPHGYKDYIFMGCDSYHQQNDLCIEPHICYNPKIDLKDSIIGGVFTVATNVKESDSCKANNPYTNEQSCPHHFEPYPLASTYWGHHPGYYCTMYICFSNSAIYTFN